MSCKKSFREQRDIQQQIYGEYKDDLQREFYIQMTKRVLTNFVEAQTYEKYLLNHTNFDLTLPAERKVQAKLAVKDEYTFDFAELSPEYSEYGLEMQLVNNVRAFLIEMGGDFTFIGDQYECDEKGSLEFQYVIENGT